MKSRSVALALALVMGGALISEAAWADRRHHRHHRHGGAHLGIVIGAPLAWPWYSPPPRYYYPPRRIYDPYYYPPYAPAVIVPSPPVYIERSDSRSENPPGYWYYCSNPAGYYPTVRDCPGGWQRVAPEVPPS